MNRNQLLVIVAIVGLLATPVVVAVTFDIETGAQTRFKATPAGPTVYYDEDRTLASPIFPADNSVRIQSSAGAAYYNGTVDTTARIDTLNGTWSNVSRLDVPAGNLTINPDSMREAKVAGDADTFQYMGEATVNDGQADAIIAGSGTADMTLPTDGTAGTQYGIVNNQTNEALAAGVANSQGVVYFEGASLETTHEVRVEELGSLTIRNETEPHALVTGSDVTVRFFEVGGETVVEKTDDDSDGEIDLSGLPVDEAFTAVVEAPGTEQRTVLIEDLSQQETVFVLPSTATPAPVEKEFVVEDQTGQFDDEGTQLIIERAINESRYNPGAGFVHQNVAGDRLGADSTFITDLQQDARYRITVRSGDGDVRQLGSFIPKSAGVTTLNVGTITVNQTEQDGVRYNATYVNTTSTREVLGQYNDSTDSTDRLYVEIHERRNRSNKLLANTTYAGPLGDVAVVEPIPQSEDDTEWVVRMTGERSAQDNVHIVEPLSPRPTVLDELPGWLAAVLSLGTIWVTAGLFSQLNADIGALVVAGEGAMFWFVGFAPGVLGVGVVVLALVTAALIFINERRDGGL
jgi:hypothetical protein